MPSTNPEALAAKARGNAAFSAKNFEEAVKEFTAAIELDPTDHVFFSNRSGSYAGLNKFKEALADADECIKLQPDWAKGYSRKGLAAFSLGDHEGSKAAYKAGLKVDPNNAALKQGLEQVEAASVQAANPMAALFGPSMWGKLQADPTTREYLKDPAFVQKCNMLQQNPNAFGSLASDPQMSQALGVILGIGSQGFKTAPGEDDAEPAASTPYDKMEKPAESKKPEPAEEEDSDEEMPELEEELTEEEKTLKANKEKAVEEKKEGNKFYVKKQFPEALAHYKKAKELDPTNPTYMSNESAVYFEQKDYDKCIACCDEAIQLATSQSGYDYSLVGKLYLRQAMCCDRQNKFDDALDYIGKSKMEDGSQKAKDLEKKLMVKKKKFDEEAYLDKDKSEEAKAAGNQAFQEQKWIDAIGHYSEALKRDPTNFKVYSNRAACYTKLMDWSRAMEDVDKCLEMEPTFVKAYIRKGKIQHFLKQYHKALVTYDKGLALDPTATELIEGKRQTMNAINQENQSGNVDPARAQEAMKDPEIQAILSDPTINNVLKQMQSDPQSSQRALQDPIIRGKIEKLVAAGILQIG